MHLTHSKHIINKVAEVRRGNVSPTNQTPKSTSNMSRLHCGFTWHACLTARAADALWRFADNRHADGRGAYAIGISLQAVA